MTNPPVSELAAQSYLYGFPLVFNLDSIDRFVREGVGSSPATPYNSFSHARVLADASATFVSVNNDTVYSIAPVDLSVGPVTLHVPPTEDRYYVMQFIDAWTDNFAYVGTRATGNREGDYLLVPPGWQGTTPDATTLIRFPTTVGVIVGRWACADEADLAAVHALQDATTLTALDRAAQPVGLPSPDPAVAADLMFLEKLRVWSQAFPPAPRDRALEESFAPIGVTTAGNSPYLDLDPDRASALRSGLGEGQEELTTAMRGGAGVVGEVWQLMLHTFDYNLDYFEVGALDDEKFKIADPTQRIVARAVAAKAGLWGNHAYEAAYAMIYVDSTGAQLNGANTYTLRLDPTPPVDAFWSVTMYSMPDFYLCANPIDRYSIGDRTPGLVYDENGALTITISHVEPSDPKARANWLPAPDGDFRPCMRMYAPQPPVIDQTYVLPQINRT
ncbi:hypothetical protein BOX37_29950 [Nocardia mangyaensis]|uniref:ATP synthase subunit alpha n=1 Tax=Nocardia mangyaensis TaxID=2213200 RepID=A0A1J0W3J1_9NOCA|nr:DUF1254 domain-containing protein [Nocardia mangyaensis]APE38860.1 hypothetical protein BOX37_29950 [Nocardia mangyaensis]